MPGTQIATSARWTVLLDDHVAALAVGGQQGALLWVEDSEAIPAGGSGWSGALAWHPDGTRAAIACGRAVQLVDRRGVDQLRLADLPSTVTGIVWPCNGRRLGVSTYGGVHWFGIDDPAPVRTMAWKGSLLELAVAPNARWLAWGTQDAAIHIWRLWSGEDLEMAGYPSKVTTLAYDPTSAWLASEGSPDVTVWEFTGRGPGGMAPRLLRAHPQGATALAWKPAHATRSRPRDAVLGTAGADGQLAFWRPAHGQPQEPQRPITSLGFGGPLSALSWEDGGIVAVGAADGRVPGIPADLAP